VKTESESKQCENNESNIDGIALKVFTSTHKHEVRHGVNNKVIDGVIIS
jgi:hypothetical protein